MMVNKGFIIPQLFWSILGSSQHPYYTNKTIPNNKSTTKDPNFYTDYFGRAFWRKDDLPFHTHRKTTTKDFWKAWRKTQPVRASWEKKKNNKKTDKEKGIEATNLIRDYSFRFANACLSGTIWILDYELPEGDNYPTKFFFGTNAHVAEGIQFDSKNPYNQVLPTKKGCPNPVSLIFRETNLDELGDRNFQPSSWKGNEKGLMDTVNTYHNVNNWLTKTDEPSYYYYQTQDIKLVYLATNFAGSGDDASKWGWCSKRGKNYLSDFAVIEIDFKDPRIAKKMTRDFHTKYHYKTGTKKHKAIDLFAKPLIERKTNKQIYKESTDIFIAGYPSNGLKERSVGSFNLENNQASKLTYISDWNMIKKDNDEIIGHSNVCHLNQTLEGYGTRRLFRGVELLLEHEPLQIGSSGSLATDGEGNALGVKSRKWSKISAIDTFRSSEIKYGTETVIPAYDLLEGIETNPNDHSYMDSIVKNNRKTHLSEMRKWGTEQSEALKPPKDRRSSKQIISPKKHNSRKTKQQPHT